MIGSFTGLWVGILVTIVGLFVGVWQSTAFNFYGMVAGWLMAIVGAVIFLVKFVELWL